MLVLVSYKFPISNEFLQITEAVEDSIRRKWRFSSYNTVVIPAKNPAEALDEFKDALYKSVDLAMRNIGISRGIIESYINEIGQVDVAVYAGEYKLNSSEFDARMRKA